MVQKIEKRQLWVRPIEWLKLNFASCVMPYTKKLLLWYWSLWPPMRYDAVARIRVQTSTAFPVIVVAPGTVRPKHWKPENGSTTILTTLAGNVMPVWCSYQGPHVHYIAGHVGVIPRYELLLPHLHQVLFLWSDNERAARTSVSNTPAHFFRSQVFFRSRFTIFIFFFLFRRDVNERPTLKLIMPHIAEDGKHNNIITRHKTRGMTVVIWFRFPFFYLFFFRGMFMSDQRWSSSCCTLLRKG